MRGIIERELGESFHGSEIRAPLSSLKWRIGIRLVGRSVLCPLIGETNLGIFRERERENGIWFGFGFGFGFGLVYNIFV